MMNYSFSQNKIREAMKKELYVAAVRGNIEFLEVEGRRNEYYLSKTSEENNIVHIAIRHEQLEFIEATLNKFRGNSNYLYELLNEGNSNKNTPLHIAAEVGNSNIMNLLFDYLESSSSSGSGVGGDNKPWREPNLKGDTPLHVALVHNKVNIAKFLLNKDPKLASIVNHKSKEAPLHVAIKQHANYSESESIMAELANQSTAEENMSSMIKYLVEKESCVASWVDASGSSPVHRAASLSAPYDLEVTKLIIKHWPQSAEVCDTSGRSVLHLLILNKKIPSYQEGVNLLNIREIYTLRNHQDNHGNTPLHLAVKNKDSNMVRVLLDFSTNLNINNREGVCATTGIVQNQIVLQMLRQRKTTRDMTREESKAANKTNIAFLKERLNKLGVDFLISQDSKGKNVLHKLLQIKNEIRIVHEDFVGFVEQALEIFPGMLCQTDQSGNTPVHVLVRNNDVKIYLKVVHNQEMQSVVPYEVDEEGYRYISLWHSQFLLRLLETCNKCAIYEAKIAGEHYIPPWEMQNDDGNTPLHEAFIAMNKTLALQLVDYDKKAVSLPNKQKETPLHLLATSPTIMEPFARKDIEKVVKDNDQAACLPDGEGLTPIARAFKASNLFMATTLCIVCPLAAEIQDTNKQTFWHLLIKQAPGGYLLFHLLQEKALRDILSFKDKNGNTPLHLAVTANRFDIVKDILDETWEPGSKSDSFGNCWWWLHKLVNKRGVHCNQWLVDLFNISNNDGQTPADLIAEAISVPPEVEKCIKKKPQLIGVRSVWGIPTTQTNNYVNAMGVIAALLATITFTAAFTVPGGLVGDTGTPIMLQKATFQVFMISDVVAMCLSMMVLVCLLKIMASMPNNQKKTSVMILDFSVYLLLASFYATIVTFMMGVFATMFTVKPWIAIFTVILCSLLILMVLKFLSIRVLLPFKRATHYVRWMLGKISCKENIPKEKVDDPQQLVDQPTGSVGNV